jgi:SAM-dependent methyltransferase
MASLAAHSHDETASDREWMDPRDAQPELLAEHVARYEFAAQFVRGLRVLDCGAGAGLGAHRLATTASSVACIDVDPAAAAATRRLCREQRVNALLADVSALPFQDGFFDVAVCFEVVEHLARPDLALAEMKRVLDPRHGLLLLSTPNRDVYRDAHGRQNRFHHVEFSFGELQRLLNRTFSRVAILPQRWSSGVVIGAPGTTSDRALRRSDYFVAVCSMAELPAIQPVLHAPEDGNLLVERTRWARSLHTDLRQAQVVVGELQQTLSARTGWAQSLTSELEHARARVAETEATIRDRTCWARSLEADLAEARARIRGLEQTLADRTAWAADLDRHIHMLEESIVELQQELETRARWAVGLDRDVDEGRQQITRLERELEERTRWARGLDLQLEEANRRLQAHTRADQENVARLEQLVDERTRWAQRVDEELTSARRRLSESQALVEQRTAWAKQVDRELAEARREIAKIRATRFLVPRPFSRRSPTN